MGGALCEIDVECPAPEIEPASTKVSVIDFSRPQLGDHNQTSRCGQALSSVLRSNEKDQGPNFVHKLGYAHTTLEISTPTVVTHIENLWKLLPKNDRGTFLRVSVG